MKHFFLAWNSWNLWVSNMWKFMEIQLLVVQQVSKVCQCYNGSLNTYIDSCLDIICCFFFKGNCGGVPHSASFLYIFKKETVQRRRKLIGVHQGAERTRKITKELYNCIQPLDYLGMERFLHSYEMKMHLLLEIRNPPISTDHSSIEDLIISYFPNFPYSHQKDFHE